jgi:hypothetical protein
MDTAKLRELLKEKNAPKAVSELALELATYADDDGNIMIGQFAPIVTYKDMATICGTSEITIKRKMKWLLGHGVIVRTPINEIGNVKVYAYRFKLEKGFRKGFDLPSTGIKNDTRTLTGIKNDTRTLTGAKNGTRRISDKQAKNEENESQDSTGAKNGTSIYIDIYKNKKEDTIEDISNRERYIGVSKLIPVRDLTTFKCQNPVCERLTPIHGLCMLCEKELEKVPVSQREKWQDLEWFECKAAYCERKTPVDDLCLICKTRLEEGILTEKDLELPALPYHLSLQTRSYYKKRL